MNYADLIAAQDENREALGDAFEKGGTESAAVTKARRKAAEAAVNAAQAEAFEAAVAEHLAKHTADQAETDAL